MLFQECDETWAERIKTEQFEWHNSHWLAMVENKALDTATVGLTDENEAFPQYDLLQQSLLLQTGMPQIVNTLALCKLNM